MTEGDPLWLQAGNYVGDEDRRAFAAMFGSRHYVDLAPSTSPLVSAGGGHGVVGAADMTVTAAAGMTVSVSLGLAIVRGTQQGDQGVYVTSNDAAKSLTISASDATNPRKDLIVTRVKDNQYGIAGDTGPLEVVAGTPTAGLTAGNATGRPTPPENALVLAEVLVPAAAVSSASFTITDLRTRAYALGGVAVCTSTTRPNPATAGMTIHETDTNRRYGYDGAAWQPISVGRRFNSGVSSVATDINGVVVVAHGLGVAPTAVTITLTTASTAATIGKSQPAIDAMDATNFSAVFRRADTDAVLASNAITFMWIATT